MEQAATLFIKGMVCGRCIDVVRSELEKIGIIPIKVELGGASVVSHGELDTETIGRRLQALGFSLLEDKKVKTVKAVKELVAKVYSGEYDFPHRFRFSDLVIISISRDYDAVSALFTSVELKTIEQYIIDYRIEKIKEFLVYTSQTLSEIAFRLNFSSVAHLSKQFKQFTGLTPSHFREVKMQKTGLGLAGAE